MRTYVLTVTVCPGPLCDTGSLDHRSRGNGGNPERGASTLDAQTDDWRLINLIGEAQAGRLGGLSPGMLAWEPEDVEALWDNILNDWPLGPVVLVDVSQGPRQAWHGWFGPHRLDGNASRRLVVIEGAGKLMTLAWSLADLSSVLPQAMTMRTAELWLDHCLVLDVDQRRARFVGTDYRPDRHLPVRLLPHAGPCIKAIQGMTLWSIEREWLNHAARRLLDCRCMVHLFPGHASAAAERMLANYRRINGLPGGTDLPPPFRAPGGTGCGIRAP